MTDGLRSRARAKVIGQRLPRVDARERVTGEARYPADLALPGMVHAQAAAQPARACAHPAHRHDPRGRSARRAGGGDARPISRSCRSAP